MATKIPLIATAEEVSQLQAIRDKRLAGQDYKVAKLEFFRQFRTKYGIKTDSRIKIETEKKDKLGVVQYTGNNAAVKVDALEVAII